MNGREDGKIKETRDKRRRWRGKEMKKRMNKNRKRKK